MQIRARGSSGFILASVKSQGWEDYRVLNVAKSAILKRCHLRQGFELNFYLAFDRIRRHETWEPNHCSLPPMTTQANLPTLAPPSFSFWDQFVDQVTTPKRVSGFRSVSVHQGPPRICARLREETPCLQESPEKSLC